MKKVFIGLGCFTAGFILGTLYDTKKEDIKDIIANEKKAIDKFKKNPKNKNLVLKIKNFIKGGK